MLYGDEAGSRAERQCRGGGLGWTEYGSDAEKDRWVPAQWVEEDFGEPAGGHEWMMLFVTQRGLGCGGEGGDQPRL